MTIDDEDYAAVSQYRWYAKPTKDGKFYAVTNRNGRLLYLQHLLMGGKTDHRDGNSLNYCRGNLRLCTTTQNNWNIGKRPSRSGKAATSKYKGVYRPAKSKKWWAKITAEGKRMVLGQFDSEQEAARAYNAKAKELFGDFAWLNPV